MKSHAIAVSLSLVLTGVFATPPGASAQFDLDLQATEIGNQLQQILNRITRYTTLLSQFTRLDCSAQGMAAGAEATPLNEAALVCDTLDMLGAFKDSYRQLLQAPTDLLNTAPPLPDWRDVLQAADTVTAADIRNVYPGGAADAAVATFERRGNYADRSVVLAHAQADATAALTDTLDAAERPLLRILKRATASPRRAWRKPRWPRHSPARGFSWLFLSCAPTRHRFKRRMPTTRKWRAGRSRRNGWPIVPLSKRSGPRSERTWPHGPTNGLNPCMAAINSRPSSTRTKSDGFSSSHQGALP